MQGMHVKIENFGLTAFQIAIFTSLIGLNPSAGAGGEGSALRQIGWVLLGTICAVGVIWKKNSLRIFMDNVRRRLSRVALIGSFVLLALISALWSDAPIVTIKRAILLAIVAFIGLVASVHATQKRSSLPLLLLKPLTTILVLSALFSLIAPSIAFSSIGWQGITSQKNLMGQVAAILVLVGLLSLEHLKPSKRFFLVLASFVALVMSSSGTAMVCLASSLLAVALIRLVATLRTHRSWWVPALVAALVVLVALFSAFIFDALPAYPEVRSALLAALGKSETLTGRTALWDLVLEQSRYRSDWIGGGYGAFWDISYTRIAYIVGRLGFAPIQAHNGYLDLFNDLGLIGLILVMAVLATYLARIAAMAVRHSSTPEAGFHIALCVYVVLANFSESSLLRTTQFLNLLFIFAFYSVGVVCAPANRKPTLPPCVKRAECPQF